MQKCVRIEAKGCGVHDILLNESAHESSGNSEKGFSGSYYAHQGSSEAHDRRDTVDATSYPRLQTVALFRGSIVPTKHTHTHTHTHTHSPSDNCVTLFKREGKVGLDETCPLPLTWGCRRLRRLERRPTLLSRTCIAIEKPSLPALHRLIVVVRAL